MDASKNLGFGHQPLEDIYLTRVALIAVWLSVVMIYLKNAWVADDAYIMFRSIEQLFAGHGPVWNLHERVQVFTSPLWYGLIALGRAFSSNLFWVSITISLLLFLSLLILFWRLLRTVVPFAIFALLMVSSNAFFDFASSGLENILAYVLITYIGIQVINANAPLKALFVSGLLVCVRHDLGLLVVAPALWLTALHWQRYSLQQWLFIYVLAALPLILWTLFSLVYYGVPIPNTAYAKLGTGWSFERKLWHGWYYLKYTLHFDIMTILVMIASGFFAILTKSSYLHRYQALMMGAAIYMVYTTMIGGDFMAGRFFSYPYLMSLMVFAHGCSTLAIKQQRQFILFCALVVYGFFYTHTPLNSPLAYKNSNFIDHVADERGYYHFAISIAGYLISPLFPNAEANYYAKINKSYSQRLYICNNIGIYGYKIGLQKIIIDPLALSDPFLSKLPASKSQNVRIGHYARQIPKGYIQSVLYHQTLIEDPYLAKYYKMLKILTEQTPLLSWHRLKTIALFNLGFYDHLLKSGRYYDGFGEHFSCTDNLTPLLAKYY